MSASSTSSYRLTPKVGEHRVREDFGQLGRAAALASLGREGLHIDVEHLGKAQEHSRRHRALVALKMIEIGAGDAELIGHLALIQPAFATQSFEPRTEKQLAL